MAAHTSTLVSVDEYLHSAYDPDCDYVDGMVEERNVGELEHSTFQYEFSRALGDGARSAKVRVLPEQRVKVAPFRYRVPDLCVMLGRRMDSPILTEPPLICVEITSREDRLDRLIRKLRDYVAMGVPHVWVVDPRERVGFIYKDGLDLNESGIFEAPEIGLRINLADIFAAIDAE
jgi:Uma2 family endonuclease